MNPTRQGLGTVGSTMTVGASSSILVANSAHASWKARDAGRAARRKVRTRHAPCMSRPRNSSAVAPQAAASSTRQSG